MLTWLLTKNNKGDLKKKINKIIFYLKKPCEDMGTSRLNGGTRQALEENQLGYLVKIFNLRIQIVKEKK